MNEQHPFETLVELLSKTGNHNEQPQAKPRPLPEAVIDDLRAAQARYGTCPFKPGDIVTPRNGYNVKDAGEPHIVLEVREMPIYNFGIHVDPTDVTSASWGRRLDMRVLGRPSVGELVPFWVESWTFQRYEEIA